jgi:hypothetical protein
MTPGGVGFSQEGYRIVETSDLGSLVDPPHVVLGGAGDHGLPNLSLEGLVGVGGPGQLRLEPGVRGFPLGTCLLVDVERTLVERLVRSFDLSDSIIVLIELVSTGLVELAEVLLGLLMLVYDGSYPAGGTGDLEDRLRW